jgi:hypothetical protein
MSQYVTYFSRKMLDKKLYTSVMGFALISFKGIKFCKSRALHTIYVNINCHISRDSLSHIFSHCTFNTLWIIYAVKVAH